MWETGRTAMPRTVHTPLVRHLTWVLRPLFAWNHRWAMRRGRDRVDAALARREMSATAEQRQALA